MYTLDHLDKLGRERSLAEINQLIFVLSGHFPGRNWEVIPQEPNAFPFVYDLVENPPEGEDLEDMGGLEGYTDLLVRNFSPGYTLLDDSGFITVTRTHILIGHVKEYFGCADQLDDFLQLFAHKQPMIYNELKGRIDDN